MAVDAIIMAGGEGIRLRPLTAHRPKPLVPLMGKPVIWYALQLLKRQGIHTAGISLWYLPKMVRSALGTGEKEGMQLLYREETQPLGTAGSVGLFREEVADTFFVLSGDGLSDCDLGKALAFHKEKKALATLILKRVEVPLAYGVVMTGEDGRIFRFLEKPDWQQVYSNQVNTGMYILDKRVMDYIPPQTKMDFGKDLFPLLLQRKERIFGYETQGYWCDVGNARACLQAQMDLLSGKVDLPVYSGLHPEMGGAEQGRFQGAFYIGKDTVIGKGAVIKNAVIGEGCVIGTGAVIENSCLWERTSVGPKARVQGSILCDEATVKAGAFVSEGCVLGKGAVVGSHAKLYEHVLLPPGGHVAAGQVCRESPEGNAHPVWMEEYALCKGTEEVCRLADAFVQVMQPRRILTAHFGDAGMEAVMAGALCQKGVQVMEGGWMTEGMLGEMVCALKADGGVWMGDGRTLFLTPNGTCLPFALRGEMEGMLLGGRRMAEQGKMGSIKNMEGLEEGYLSRVLPENGQGPLMEKIAVFCPEKRLLELVAEGLKRMQGKRVRLVKGERGPVHQGETGFCLAPDGKKITCLLDGEPMDETDLLLLRLDALAAQQGVLYDGEDVPRAAQEMAQVLEADESPGCCFQQRRLSDGVVALFDLCRMMKEGSLKERAAKMPKVHRLCREVACREGEKGRILFDLCRAERRPYTLSRGMQVQHSNGYAAIVPHPSRASVRIFAEAVNMEAAGELCDFYQQEIKRTLQKNQDF